MPTVALRFSSLPEHVRTARLVAVSVARRAGFGETQLDEIRIAVGEACGRAVTRAEGGLVGMTLCDDHDRLDVQVTDLVDDQHTAAADEPPAARVEPAPRPGEAGTTDPQVALEAADVAELAAALLEGVSDSVTVGGGTDPDGSVRMSWELDRH